MSAPFDSNSLGKRDQPEVAEIKTILQRLNQSMTRDEVVQSTTNKLIDFLQVNRVVLYHFFLNWSGRGSFESLSDHKYSILGSTGPDDCFNGEYAQMYLEGRVSAISNIEEADIASCHREFLREIDVQANLVVPILIEKSSDQDSDQDLDKGLWGLLVAHHCEATRVWTAADIEQMRKGAARLAAAPSVRGQSGIV